VPLAITEPVYSTATLDLHCDARVSVTTVAAGIAEIRVTLRGHEPIRTGLVDASGHAFTAAVTIGEGCQILDTRGGDRPATMHDHGRRARVGAPPLLPGHQAELCFVVAYDGCRDARFCEVTVVHGDPEVPGAGDSWLLIGGFPVHSAPRGAVVVGAARCAVSWVRGQGRHEPAPGEVLQWSRRVRFVSGRAGCCPHDPCFGEGLERVRDLPAPP
jgi:hypothetical protein